MLRDAHRVTSPEYLEELVRYHAWATGKLLAFVRQLPRDQLKLTAPGTFGRLEITAAHIVKSDEYYLELLTGQRVFEALPPLGRIADVDLADLSARTASNGARFAELIDHLPDPAMRVADDGETATMSELFVQAMHHANEHRAHIGTILGANDLRAPDVSGWAFAKDRAARVVSGRLVDPGSQPHDR